MAVNSLPLIEVSRLQPGMYLVLDLGWRRHPFPMNSFTLRSTDQIETLQSLGLDKVRYCPERSTVPPLPPSSTSARPSIITPAAAPALAAAPAANSAPPRPTVSSVVEMHLDDPVEQQQARLKMLEQRYRLAAQQHQLMLKRIGPEPGEAARACEALADDVLGWMPEQGEAAIRLLGPGSGDQPSGHEISVATLCLMLGRDCDMPAPMLRHLVLAGLLHDAGKQRVPSFLHEDYGQLTEFERQSYRQHVEFGVEMGRRMELPTEVVDAIAQHHEHADGSGFPRRLELDALNPVSRVLSVCNRYHNLVCPLHAEIGLTPHRALQRLFREERERFDPTLLARFVKLLGVYPPGTLVELTDHRMAIVVASQPGNSLAPRVQIVDLPDDPRPSLAIDLDPAMGVGVRCGLAPEQLNVRWAARARQLARSGYALESLAEADRIAA
jgi:putative nucleotidyltransferase with HDIG domain